jgi:hypothetical protein
MQKLDKRIHYITDSYCQIELLTRLGAGPDVRNMPKPAALEPNPIPRSLQVVSATCGTLSSVPDQVMSLVWCGNPGEGAKSKPYGVQLSWVAVTQVG